MAAMGILEKKAVEHTLAGDFKAAADIYEKLANLRLDIDMACQYMSCSAKIGQMHDALKMVDKYVSLLKWEIKPQYKQFYLQASIICFTAGRKEESLYFVKRAEECDPEDDFVLFQRLLCENALGVMDNVRADEDRILAFLNRYADGAYGDGMFIPPLGVSAWFADSELLYRITKQSSASFNKIERFEHTPTLDHMIKPKIKIGYLSAHVREHPAMHISWNHFGQHNSQRFETHGFFHGADYSYAGAKAFAESLDGYSNLDDMSDSEAAHYIMDMGIDILVDLCSMVEGARSGIVARKPAPIIMHYQGYYGTTCLDAVDYKITDLHTTPTSDMDNFSEKMAYLPVFAQTSKWTQPIDKSLQKRSKWGLPEDAFVFGNMCSVVKYTPEVISAWMTILDNVENSVLWISEPPCEETKDMLHHYANQAGLNSNRIIFAPRVDDKDQHMSRLPCMDMHLDTNIFSGHTTTFDMVEMGVFPLCIKGTHHSSRFSEAILSFVGCGDMVAKDIDEYIKTAVVLGRDKELTKTWSEHLYKQAVDNGLFDTKGLIESLEDVYETTYTRWVSGLAPDNFITEPLSQNNTIDLENVDYLVNQETHNRISQYSEQT